MNRSIKNFRAGKALVQSVIVLVALAAGALVARHLIRSRTKPVVERKMDLGPLVVVHTVEKKDVPVKVEGFGTVQPRIQVELVPQVAGKVIATHPALAAGGFFLKDDVLVTIDPTDYELALRRSEAALERARVALDLQKAEGEVAAAEWKSMNPDQEPPTPLVLRRPQIQQAEAELHAAEAEVQSARINLERTKLSLPFNGRILTEQVDVGQFVTAGKPIATAYGTDTAEVRIPLEDQELQWLDLPAAGDGRVPATVEGRFAGKVHQWQGQAVRTLASLDALSRVVTLVVEVKQPFDAPAGHPPLIPGMFVNVKIDGRTLHDVYAVPRHALREGGTVWVAEEERLRIRKVQPALRVDREFAYLEGGLHQGDEVITSPLDTITDGMRIRTHAGTPSKKPPVAPLAETP